MGAWSWWRNAQRIRWYAFWLAQVDPLGNIKETLELPGAPDEQREFAFMGRTADGGLYVAWNPLSYAINPPAHDYRVMKLAPPPVPPVGDLSGVRLRTMRELQGVIQQDGFLLSMVGMSNQTYVIEHSADLVNWTELGTYQVVDRDIRIRDFAATNASMRFYRTRSVE